MSEMLNTDWVAAVAGSASVIEVKVSIVLIVVWLLFA